MSEQLQAEGQDLQLFRGECLGSGSYGKVCKAKLNELPCAAKLLHIILFQFEDPRSQTIRRRFEQECEILKNTRHPNVVQYLSMTHDPQSGLPILLMELLDGNLTNFLEHREEPLPYHLQVNLWHDIALALTYLHSKQIIHRDLSGNNVLLIAGSRAKVTDFGMSKLSVVDASMSRLTQCPGTPLYMSPEALRTPPVYTDKLDVFSSGVVAVQIITRNYPDPGPDMLEVEDPNAPTGIMFAPIPEVERRKNHIDLIDPDHPMLPVIKNCLDDKEKERPSAQQLCHQLVTLKQAPEYAQSVQQPTPQERRIQEQEQLIQEQQKQIQDQRKEKEQAVQQVAAMKKEIQELEQQMQTQITKSERAIQVLNTQLHEKSLELHLKKQELGRTQYNLQQKTKELEQKTAQQKVQELEQKTEEFRQKIEKVQGRLHQALQGQGSHEFQVNITELESKVKDNQDPGRLVEQLPLDALEQQKAAYERELAKLKEKLDVSSTSISPTPPVQKPPVATSLEEEWEYKNRERFISTMLHANRLVQEANMLAHELNKETVFKVTLTVPRSFLSPRKMKSDDMSTSNEVAIRVLHKQRGTDSVWSLDQLEEKVLTMRDMYQRMEEEGRGVPMLDEPDPFYDLEQHALLGVANIYVEALHHDVRHEYDAPIIAPTGKECGKLKVAVQRVPTHVPDRDPGEDVDGDEPDWPLYEEVCELRSGVRFSCQVSVIEATGLPKEYCHYVFCQYHFWNQEEPMIIPPLVQSVTEKLPDGMQKFDHSQTFTVEVTEDFLEYLETGVLAVEVWGHRRSGFIETGLVSGPEDAVERRPKSFLERWREHTHHLELWVEIMELNEQGEYESVETQTKADVLTGGVFMMRQGQSRRISVLVNQREGAGSVPLMCGPIKSISIGSIYLRSRYDGPLDSYQGHDIERLRSKWCSAVANRREFLDSELRKLMDRKGATVTEMERQNELLDQWAMLSWQRQALLEPRAGSGLPGAPTNWQLSPGMEEHVPVLFLDLNDDLSTPCDDNPVSAVRTGELFAEKEDTMIELPIIKRDDTQPKATASWDSTVHDNSSLNKVTGSNNRVYAILKVAVALTHPPGIDLVLRKRICLRVEKRRRFGSTIMKAITPTRDVKTGCGVMFDVVTGIPKSEGMQRPPKIPANPSFMELNEDENAVEKFKMAMASISNILTLDRLKQEVALKEKLSRTGQALKKHYSLLPLGDMTPVTVSPSPCSSESEGAHEVIVKVSLLPSHALPSQPQSLSRADSGNIYNRAESPQMGDEKHEDDDMAKENAEKMDLSEVPSVLTTSSEGEVAEGEVAEGEVTQEETQENSNEQEESVMKSQEAIPLLQEPPSSQVNLGRRYSEGDINPSSPVKHKPPPAPHSQRASPNLEKSRHQQAATSPRSRRDLSPTPSTESESSSSSISESTPTEPPPFAVGERVIVEIPQGFKLAVVKFIGETEFAAGEWIGVAFERPIGKNNGNVNGVKYFKCKDKHGMFVQRDKITIQSSSPATSRVSSRSSASKSLSPLSQQRVPSNPNTLTRPTIASSAKRSQESGGSSGGHLQFPKV